jgi:hypothetical protein
MRFNLWKFCPIGVLVRLHREKLHKLLPKSSRRSKSSFAWRLDTRLLISRKEPSFNRLSRTNFNGRSRNLTTLSNDTLRPLHTFTLVPPVVEGVFERLEPSLQLFLGSNQLNALPEALFNIPQLTVLSVRANNIRELNPAIGRLRSLAELNISQNKLQYLPFEILDLFEVGTHLETFTFSANRFLEIQRPPSEDEKDVPQHSPFKPGSGLYPQKRLFSVATSSTPLNLRRKTWNPLWNIVYKARTKVRFLDMDGSLIEGPNISNQTLFGPKTFRNGVPVADVNDVPTPPRARGNPVSRVPSLLEVALQSCSRHASLSAFSSYLEEPYPESFPVLLANAAAKKEAGGTKCTICNRNFIIPRTEWIEWWEINKASEKSAMASAASPLGHIENNREMMERIVPFIRRGCSWRCVAEELAVSSEVAVEGDTMELDATR